MNRYCNAMTPNPGCTGCDYCLGSEGAPPIRGYEWVQNRPSYNPTDSMTHDLDCACLYCVPGA